MPSRFWSRRRRVASGAVLLLVGAGVLAATCDAQDYLARQRLELADAPVFEPVAVTFDQPFRGLNSMDFEVTNTGSEPGSFGLFVEITGEYEDEEEAVLPLQRSATRLIGPLAAGQIEQGRFFESELGLGDTLFVEFQCFDEDAASASTCSGVLTILPSVRRAECRVDTDCSADEQCELDLGICRADQAVSGCRTADSGAATPPWSIALALFALILSAARSTWRRDAP